MSDSLPLLFFSAVASGIVAWLILHRVLLGRLARDHATAFPKTQSRTIFEQGAMLQFFFICEFIFKKTYARLGDGSVTALSRILKLLIPLIILSFLGMMLSPMFIEVLRR